MCFPVEKLMDLTNIFPPHYVSYFGLNSDHAWGGNYFMASGSLKGGEIFGEYPDDLTDAGPQIVSDVGIVMPSTPWEALWNGVAQWFGVDRYDYCLIAFIQTQFTFFYNYCMLIHVIIKNATFC